MDEEQETDEIEWTPGEQAGAALLADFIQWMAGEQRAICKQYDFGYAPEPTAEIPTVIEDFFRARREQDTAKT